MRFGGSMRSPKTCIGRYATSRPWSMQDGVARPRWLLLNGLPLHRQRDFVTLNAIGTAFCPYRVQSRPGLVAELEALGYRKLDAWENEAKPLNVPFHPELSIPAYSGFCFERIEAAAQPPRS